jgi:hypothetical protein
MSRMRETYTITCSADGSAGKESARSSVFFDVRLFCNPDLTSLQEVPTSGKHAGSDASSSMRCQRLKGSPQTRKASRQFSLGSSQFAPKVRCVAQPFVSSFPHSPPGNGRLLFGSDQSEQSCGSRYEVRATIAS